jgi:DNA-binding CsgD family transcriptional regulator/tetratricopeptide (TPR) repeat protein
VRDAVLARMARLSPAGRVLLEAASVVPPPVEVWLLKELAGSAVERLDECLAAGVLTAQGRDLAFRHELARIAVEDSLSPHVQLDLHGKALAALRGRPIGTRSAARLAHHADAAGAGEAVLEFAPEAAVRAAAVGAHREAAAQYARALRFAGGLSVEARGELLDARARECNSIGQLTEAIKVYSEALGCHRASGDRRKEGDALRAQSFVLWAIGHRHEAEVAVSRAVAVLEELPPGPELAFAYWTQSNMALYIRDLEKGVEWASLALELGQRLGHSAAIAYARMNISWAAFLDDPAAGEDELARQLEAARDAGLEELAATAFTILAFGSVRFRDQARARRWLEPGIQYCGEHDLDGWRPFAIALRSELELQEGRWDDAASSAAHVLAGVEPEPEEGGGVGGASTVAWAVLGRVRARRGDPDHWAPLDRALALAQPTGELLRLAPVAPARAEAAWLEGHPESEAEATAAAFEVALQHKDPWAIGEIGYWLARTGVEVELPAGAAEPYALQMAGDWRGAADRWAQLGCPYEEALALAEADDDDALRGALARLQEMGARTAATIVARRLRQRGATGLPRGPRPGTQANPANLTAREVEVLALVAEGLRNADIAAQLFLSERTVAHHVSAILRKLEVQSRAHASAAAVRLGIADGREHGP